MNMPEYDPISDRYFDGDEPLPRDDDEAREMGLHYDPATRAWYSGNELVVEQKIIDAYTEVNR